MLPPLVALTREVSPAFERCELTQLPRRPIDVELARRQHEAYERALGELGCRVERLAAEPAFPDSVFVEDAAVVLDDLAVITRPGAASRRGETESAARGLAPYRRLLRIRAPAVLDGGDVLRIGTTLYVGLSGRTDAAGVAQLRALVAPEGYSVTAVEFSGCLHLKSAASLVGPDTLLVNPALVDAGTFPVSKTVAVDPAEPGAANALAIGSRVLAPAQFPRTLERLRNASIDVLPVEVSELVKAESGVTCCSLVFREVS